MARYEHLPVYRKAFDLCIYFEKLVRNFSKYDKYTLGSDLRNKSRAIACQIMRANSVPDKKNELVELVALIEELKLVIRLCKEAGAFKKFSSYEYSSGLIVDLGKQSQAWLNSQK
ncbi:MAG: four helix bundle protein [archaeon]